MGNVTNDAEMLLDVQLFAAGSTSLLSPAVAFTLTNLVEMVNVTGYCTGLVFVTHGPTVASNVFLSTKLYRGASAADGFDGSVGPTENFRRDWTSL